MLQLKIVWANNAPFMNKRLSKAIMTRDYITNIKITQQMKMKQYLKSNEITVLNYPGNPKRTYNKLDIFKVTYNKTFWNSIKPLFSDKQNVQQKIVL